MEARWGRVSEHAHNCTLQNCILQIPFTSNLASKFVRNIITKNPMMIVSRARLQRLARETTMMMHPLRFMGVYRR